MAGAERGAVGADLHQPDAAPGLLGELRAVVTAYEAVVQRYPASGYADNALWQGARLSMDAFARFNQPADKDAAARLFKKLASMYPTSRLARQVPEQLTRMNSGEIRVLEDVVISHTPPAATRPTAAAPATTDGAVPAAGAPVSTRIATIKDIRRVVLPDAVRITIELDSEVAFHEERIPDPARVFVDLPGTRASPALIDQTLRFESDADIIRQVRVGRHPNNTTRIVLDAAGVTSYSVYPLYSPYRLVIDCVRVSAAVTAAAMTDKVLGRVAPAAAPAARQSNEAAAAAKPLAPLPARTMTNPWLRKLPGLSPRSTALLAAVADAAKPTAVVPAAVETTPIPSAVATPARHGVEGSPAPAHPSADQSPRSAEGAAAEAATAAPAHNATGGLSMARQLGLGVSRIVIDPGHGGHDPGAKGKGVNEAELVLDVALRLEKLLQKVPGVDVILTRRTDEFIQLPERTAIANREGADLFLSIHANASINGQAHGIETYFLNFANNHSAAAVAARENAASTQAMGGLPDFVKAIAMNNKLDESRDLALQVQRSMVDRQRASNKALKDLGVKQAPFVVLIGANMPSVLAEMGFVTNPQEAKLLKGNAYRQKIAESLFNAIRKYQTSLKNVSSVALQ
jgi:N-acetylmuramoyl-L-alanine amidase